MSDTGKIAEALAAFQSEMPIVAKTHTAKVPTKAGGSYSYTYADLADVTEAAMPLLSKNGLSFSTCPRAAEGRGYELVGILLHTSGERLEGTLPIAGNSPQEYGSSLTYMRRYLLGCLTGIVTDDDDDGGLAQKAATRKPAARSAPAAPPHEPWSDEPPDLTPAPTNTTPLTTRTRGQMFALFAQKGVPDDAQLPGINHITGANYQSRKDITEAHAKAVIAVLKTRPDEVPVAPVEDQGGLL